MRVIGIDPGLNITGYGVLDDDKGRLKIVEVGVIRTKASKTLSGRLLIIASDLNDIIKEYSPEVMSIEELYSHYAHPKTAIIMGHARGVILLKAAETGIDVVSYAATRIKNAITGHGRATKEQMQHMIKSTLGLSEIPEPADAADAVAIALCHIQACDHTIGARP